MFIIFSQGGHSLEFSGNMCEHKVFLGGIILEKVNIVDPTIIQFSNNHSFLGPYG